MMCSNGLVKVTDFGAWSVGDIDLSGLAVTRDSLLG